MIQGWHHTSFTVSNLEESERFFVEVMGMKRIGGGLYDFDYLRRHVGYLEAVLNIAVLSFPGSGPNEHLLELIEYIQPAGRPADTAANRPGNAHLCFLVSDIDAEVRRLKAAGLAFRCQTPNEVTWGINKGAKVIYFHGPDDIVLELYQPAQATAEASP